MKASLDIRWPIGMVFSLIGLLLVAYGALYVEIDAWWGGCLLIFGVGMLFLAQRSQASAKPPP